MVNILMLGYKIDTKMVISKVMTISFEYQIN